VPARGDARCGQLERRIDADAVDHQRRPATAGGAPNVARVEPVGLHHDVGAGLEGHVEGLLTAVDRDDAATAQRP
jgi:hypothetical protein